MSAAKRQLSEKARGLADGALKTLNDIHKDRKAPHSARVSAATAILDRAYGRPPQSLEHTGKDGAPLAFVDLTKATDDQLSALESFFGPLAGSGDDAEGDPTGEGKAPTRG
ncbi:hypothetical protein [Rhodobium gokarnense]|uniref:Uncharacterized protein n=1 Tax=Rhodobium gokarnense TaxID=364296 RepID=A0ABT3HHH7_9HYPH|nr:hypothetical protein [Rhodobium gokarnense]MCW2309706.1 hypothetical protein [Rhodobium gokarnense]